MSRSAPHIVQSIIALRDKELTDRQIAAKLGIHHKTVAHHRRRFGLTPNGQARRFLKIVDEHQAECSRCHQIKPLKGWPRQRRLAGPSYRYSYCADCKRAHQNKAVNRNDEANLRNRWRRLQMRARKLGVVCEVTFNEFLGQWRAQNGRCFYTDIPLHLDFGEGTNPNRLSVDKVDPARGYIYGNVVFAARRINTIKHDVTVAEMKEWMPAWHERVMRWQETMAVAGGAF